MKFVINGDDYEMIVKIWVGLGRWRIFWGAIQLRMKTNLMRFG